MKLTWLFLSIFITNKLSAQTFSFAAGMGSNLGYQRGYSVATDASGNIYTTGIFSGSVDFDPGAGVFMMSAGSQATYDMFLQKLDVNGNFLWAKQLAGDSSSAGYGITIDPASNIYLTGFFIGTKDFNLGTGVFHLMGQGAADIYVLKLDNNGNFIWAKQMGGNGAQGAIGISLDPSGNILVTGRYQLTADFDPGPGVYNLTAVGQYDLFAFKLDNNGNFNWANSAGGIQTEYSNSIATDISGNVYTIGHFAGTADFDPGPVVSNLVAVNQDIFIWKLGPGGNYLWTKQMAGNSISYGTSLAIDASSNVYYIGSYSGTVDFDPGPGSFPLSSSTRNTVVSRLNPSGELVWAKQIPGTSNQGNTFYHENDIAIDATGNVYTTGQYEGTGDFDPGNGINNLTSVGGNDIFIQKLDNSGNFIWAVSMGGSSDDNGIAIAVNNVHVITTGSFESTADFDPGTGVFNLTSNGQEDIFIQKLIQASCSLPPQPGPITGTTSVCSGSSQVYSINTVTGANSYTWTLPAGWTGSSTSNTITSTVGLNSGNILVTANNNCGASSAQSLAITVNSVPSQPGAISGNTTVATGQSITYSINPVPGATNYSWMINGGGTITSGQNTNSITVNWASAGNYTLTVNATNTCGTSTNQSVDVTVSIPTGVINPDNQFHLTLSPNPSNGNFYLRAKNVINKKINLEVSDMLGNQILQTMLIPNTTDYTHLLKLDKYPAGIYQVKISIGNKVYARRIIKVSW